MSDEKKTYPPPFSLRLTCEERERLERDAAGLTLAAYIRSKLFGDDVSPRKTRGKFPVKDQKALGQVLGALGQPRLPNNLNQLARAVNTGSLPVTPDTEARLKDACQAIITMRCDLLQALGLGSEGEP